MKEVQSALRGFSDATSVLCSLESERFPPSHSSYTAFISAAIQSSPMSRLPSCLDNRLTLKTFSLYESKMPKTSLVNKIRNSLSTSMENVEVLRHKSSNWRSREVLSTKKLLLVRKDSGEEDAQEDVDQSTLVTTLKRSLSTQRPARDHDHKYLKNVEPRLRLKGLESQYRQKSPHQLKFRILPLQPQDAEFKRKEKKISKQSSQWKSRTDFLRAMIPAEEWVPPPPLVRVPRIPIQKDKITSLIQHLQTHIEYFINIFDNPFKVSNLLKSLQGYNPLVQAVLFKNSEITRILTPSSIQKHFQVFKEEPLRSQDYIDKDIRLYTALLFFNLKMQQKASFIEREFLDRSSECLQTNIKIFSEQHLKLSKTSKEESKPDTLHFLAEKRSLLPTFSKVSAIQRLEEMGMKFGINEKMKDKVLSNKESLFTNCASELVKSVDPYIIFASNP